MSIDLEAGGGESFEVAGASVHFEGAFAVAAEEVVVVGFAAEFVAVGFAGEMDGLGDAFIHEGFNVPVDGGDADAGHAAFGGFEEFEGAHRPLGFFEHGEEHIALFGFPFHRS